MKEKILELIFGIFIVFLFFSPLIIAIGLHENQKPSNDIEICKNVQKLYKDDILFDNFYISCNDKTIEIGKELYTRIIENKDYKIIYNQFGGIYKIEKVDD